MPYFSCEGCDQTIDLAVFDHEVRREYCPICEEDCDIRRHGDIDDQVRGAADEIIDRKGATYYAIALATTDIIETIVRDENSILTVSTLMDGHHGLSDVYLSLPCVLNRNGIRQIIDLDLDDREEAQFVEAGEVLGGEIEKLDI